MMMNKEKLKEILHKHKFWIEERAGGEKADLSKANLIHADLRNADLRGASLSHAKLINVDLRGADLRNADLIHADLSHADLTGADLRNADLRGANIDFSCWPLSCRTSDLKLCKKLQAQLLAHAFKVSPDCKPTDEQMDFIKENFHRYEEFWGNDV